MDSEKDMNGEWVDIEYEYWLSQQEEVNYD